MRIIQFDEPGAGTRVGVTRGDDVYDVTGPAGAGSLALLLAVRDGRAPDLSGGAAGGVVTPSWTSRRRPGAGTCACRSIRRRCGGPG